jgi:Lrp/AsnC family transcriptional regulator, leucine-responsive regulatory protein
MFNLQIIRRTRMIDVAGYRILTILQEHAREANAEIARRVGLAASAVYERIRKLEERDIIQGYEVRLNPKAVGLGLAAFIYVRADERIGSLVTGYALAKIPHVQEVHNIAGEDCYLVKVRVKDTEHLAHLLRDHFGAIPTVRSTRTTIVLDTLKETARLALPSAEPESEEASA